MAAMDLQALRDFILVSLDTDTEEIPNTLLDLYIKEGFDRAIGESDTWSFYARQEGITTVAGQQAYNFGGNDAERDPAFAYAYRSITDIRSDNVSLMPVAHAAIRRRYRVTSPSTSRPYFVSEFGNEFHLWPLPDTTYDLVVAGYRAPIDWVPLGSGAEPDMPEEFHETLAYWGLSRGQAQQGDPDMAQYYASTFQSNVRQMKARYSTPVITGPMIQNGGEGASSNNGVGIGRPIYDWE